MPSPTRRRRSLPVLLLLGLALLCGCAPAVSRAAPVAPAPSGPGPAVGIGGDTLSVLPRGVVAFPVIRRLIETARRRVDVEIYEFGRADIAADLVDAHRRGGAVTVVTDPTVPASEATAENLPAARVAVAGYPVRRGVSDP